MKEQLGFYIDQGRCVGCRTCQVACKDYHGHGVGTSLRRVYEYVGGDWMPNGKGQYTQDVYAYYTSISCNHCAHPICKAVCPTGAIEKREEDGIVHIQSDKCIGCKACINACPYNGPQYNAETGKAEKCNMCLERQEVGKQPICVESCPTRAIGYGKLEQLRKDHGTVAATAPLITTEVTNPSLVIKPSKDAKPVGDKTGVITGPNPNAPVHHVTNNPEDLDYGI